MFIARYNVSIFSALRSMNKIENIINCYSILISPSVIVSSVASSLTVGQIAYANT